MIISKIRKIVCRSFSLFFSYHFFSRCFVSVPKLMKLLFYSEILDQHYAVCVTRRTVAKIEEATTFDHYILKV
jgi:hypothetical protein